MPQLGGNGPVEIIIVKDSAHTRTQKRERRQQCGSRCSTVTIIASEAWEWRGSLTAASAWSVSPARWEWIRRDYYRKGLCPHADPKEGKASAVRQQMLYSNNNRIRSVGVAGFAYRYVSSVSFPSSVGMDPSRLFSERRLPTRGPQKRERRQQCGSRCSTVTIIASEAWEWRGSLTGPSASSASPARWEWTRRDYYREGVCPHVEPKRGKGVSSAAADALQ